MKKAANGSAMGSRMSDAQLFTVQPCLIEDGVPQFSECISIDALSAVDAAEKALRARLSLCGSPDRLRAKVWRLGDDFQPISTLLYEPEQQAGGALGSR